MKRSPSIIFSIIKVAFVVASLCVFFLYFTGYKPLETNTEDNIFERAEELEKFRNYPEAGRAYERYLLESDLGSNRFVAWSKLVYITINVNNNRAAGIEMLESMLFEFASDKQKVYSIRLILAEECEEARKYFRALQVLNDILASGVPSDVEQAEVLRSIARINLLYLDFHQAELSLNQCLNLDISQDIKSGCLFDLANLYTIKGDSDKSIESLQKILSWDNVPSDVRVMAIFFLADALEQKGDKQIALQLFESIRKTYPNPKVVSERIIFLNK